METRRTIVAILAAVAVFVIYTSIYNRLHPRKPPVATPAATSQPAATPTATPARSSVATTQAQSAPGAAGTATAPSPKFRFAQATAVEDFTLGGGPDDDLKVGFTSQGASVERIELSKRKKNGKYVYAKDADTNEPYPLLKPVEMPNSEKVVRSFLTPQLLLGGNSFRLDDLNWTVVERTARSVRFEAVLEEAGGGTARLRIHKTFTLKPHSGVMELRLEAENPTSDPVDIQLEQAGPVGIKKEHIQYDMRTLVRARKSDGEVKVKGYRRSNLKKGVDLGSSIDHFFWIASANRYFAVFMRPLGGQPLEPADFVQKASGSLLVHDTKWKGPGDYFARLLLTVRTLAPGAKAQYDFEIYVGTKNNDDLAAANPAYADRKQIGYVAAADADARCCCTLPIITNAMTWSLESIRLVVRNYGVAIIILVLIIRALLHPLSVFQQKSMYRMQEAQARLQPQIAAIKAKYPNDKQKQNQETMKLYAKEGVNPMAGVIGMVPMLIQMPILISLWTALNTDVHLRHAMFDPWWITDLASPDQFIKFAHPITIPVLGQLPLIGRMFSEIPSINLLPLLMGVSMWLQQKYMPKPGMDAKLKAAQAPRHEKHAGMSPEDQLRQQQMMSYLMAVLFPLMFYYWPSGLNLYWFATNVFGIGESILIRKQLKAEKERREREGPQPAKPKKSTGPVGRFFKRLAEQAEELQKKADELSQNSGRRDDNKRGRKR